MNSDMAPLPGDDYMMLCLKLQAAAKLWNKAQREALECPHLNNLRLVTVETEARALLDACIRAMGEPVVLGATEARVG